MPTSERTENRARDLADRLPGRVWMPGDDGWDDARQAWNLTVDQNPVAVVFPETADDVVEAVRLARVAGLRVAPQATGHNAPPLGPLDDAILLRTGRMRAVAVDPAARRARAEAGALWADVVAPAAEHGLAGLAGSAPDVSVVGYMLGGGIGWLGRRHGVAANTVRAIELVTGEGRLVRADAEENADLFWALRGGGGAAGVVVAIEIELLPLAEVHAGVMYFAWERAGEVLQRWREWAETVPDEVTSLGRLLQLPPLPQLPDHLRGRRFAAVEAAILADEATAAALLAPLRELGPEMDTFATVAPPALQEIHMDPPTPVPGMTGHMLLDELPTAAVDAFVAAAGPGSGSPLLSIELRHLGGALARPADDGGALSHLDAGFVMFGAGMAMDTDSAAAVLDRLATVKAALAAWGSDRDFANFAEARTAPARLWGAEAGARLAEIARRHDPDGVLLANHPATAG
jgi:FAD/FMN-containing dehydrogenase